MLSLNKLGACMVLVSCLAAAASKGGGGVSFPHKSALPVVATVSCLDKVLLRRTALVR